jgi:GTPase SAR1 family protein
LAGKTLLKIEVGRKKLGRKASIVLVLQVVFAVDDSESFEEAKRIVEEIRERNEKKSPILLLANKTDTFETDNEWALLDKMARRFALEHRILYFSITAKDSDKVT